MAFATSADPLGSQRDCPGVSRAQSRWATGRRGPLELWTLFLDTLGCSGHGFLSSRTPVAAISEATPHCKPRYVGRVGEGGGRENNYPTLADLTRVSADQYMTQGGLVVVCGQHEHMAFSSDTFEQPRVRSMDLRITRLHSDLNLAQPRYDLR